MRLPRWAAARLRRRFGPSRVELQQDIDGLRAEIDRLEVKLAERTARVALVEGWNARANAECREAHQLRKVAEKEVRRIQREVLDSLILREPGPGAQCVKTRLHTEAEALVFARLVADRVKLSPEMFGVYKCKICPRHPATTERFWHIGNVDPRRKEITVAQEGYRHALASSEGRMLGQRITPETMARLRRVQSG